MRIVDDDLLKEFRQKRRCEWCNKAVATGLDPHHIFARGVGGGGRLDVPVNLLSLCRFCHNDVHMGKIKRHDLLIVVGLREGKSPEEIENEVHQLRRTKK